MQDNFGRSIEYLRFSVTDRCDLRCHYCMPPEGVVKKEHAEILSYEEIVTIARVAVSLGVRRIRLTGGEPLVRPGIVDLVQALSQLKANGLQELNLTTNAQRLGELARPLREAGLDRLNISLDTLDAAQYEKITNGGKLAAALSGLGAARAAGFTQLKINAVLMGGVNEDQITAFGDWSRREDIEIRFIELMPLGVCRNWPAARFIPADTVLAHLPALIPDGQQGVSAMYRWPKGQGLGRIGLITPLSHHFCQTCNRLRVTADGWLMPCLHGSSEWQLKGLSEQEIRRQICDALAKKPAGHHLQENGSETSRCMHQIGG